MLKFLIALLILTSSAQAHAEKILFIPHDDRPVSFRQPAEVVSMLGYEIISPNPELLTEPDLLWAWLNDNAASADAAVLSTDALLYGGLIPSRSHQIDADILNARVQNFKALRDNNPKLQIYAFGSLMRTPQFGTPGDREEPDYYGEHGVNIFQLTALLDKQETDTLKPWEKLQLESLQNMIPDEILDDYFARRLKNLSATVNLLDFAADGTIDYFIIGRDDNSELSQTHRENRQLLAYMEYIPKTKAQSLAGIDEYAMLLLTRAVNDLRGESPGVNVQFNRGRGKRTVPAYSDEQIGNSILDEILIAGAKFTDKPDRADFILMVNTDPKGNTYHFHNAFPPQGLTESQQKYFARNAEDFTAQIEDALNKNLPVGVADIVVANGSDNFLMAQLRDKNLLFKLQSYAGWNTATNSTGFALGAGILAKKMSRSAKNRLLATRYLDDWGFQANVRSQIAEELSRRPDGLQIYLDFGEYEAAVVERENQLMHAFADENLPLWKDFTVSNPWRRMFECDVNFE